MGTSYNLYKKHIQVLNEKIDECAAKESWDKTMTYEGFKTILNETVQEVEQYFQSEIKS